ncbi:MAG TPA: hypothetical protein VLM91_21025 [Candidatus Methylomirabilis sp.]|nr:hypothetical protein [Candidatus Methylomirabilis sp.]
MKVPCPQCSGEIQLHDTTGLVGCPFCGTSLVLDLTGVRLHLLYRPRHAGGSVLPLLRRWCDSQSLPLPSLLSAPHLVYYPFWRFRAAGRSRLAAAWPTLEARWADIPPPEGELVVYDHATVGSAQVVEASVAEAAARARTLGKGATTPGDLIHIPFFEARVRIGGHQVLVSLEACSAHVYPDRIPPGARGPSGRSAFSAWTAILGSLAMALEAMLIPAAWMAAIAVALTAVAFYWAILSDAGGTAS